MRHRIKVKTINKDKGLNIPEVKILDPRPAERQATLAEMTGKLILGFEVSVEELSDACFFNVDPQHLGAIATLSTTTTTTTINERSKH